MSDKHLIKLDEKLGHKENAGSKSGACLNRHKSGAPDGSKRSSCWYRWQAYDKMEGDASLYNWPKYEKLAARKRTLNVEAPGMPPYAARRLDVPLPPPPHKGGRKVGNWDVGGYCERRRWGVAIQYKNFYERSSVPYNHQAHHVIPDGVFNDTILEFFAKVSPLADQSVRQGLLKNKYNLNEDINMIMLPMDKLVADTIGLPRHQQTWAEQSHSAYCNRVKLRLKEIFAPLKDQMEQHQTREYDVAKGQLESLSDTLYGNIKKTSAASLPEMADSEFS